MAKGFTVKAAVPTKKKKEGEWDIDAIKERMRGKAIVFCLPGRGCSLHFEELFNCALIWTEWHEYSD